MIKEYDCFETMMRDIVERGNLNPSAQAYCEKKLKERREEAEETRETLLKGEQEIATLIVVDALESVIPLIDNKTDKAKIQEMIDKGKKEGEWPKEVRRIIDSLFSSLIEPGEEIPGGRVYRKGVSK